MARFTAYWPHWRTLAIRTSAVVICAVGTAIASDQTIIISQQPRVCQGVTSTLDINSAASVIAAALGTSVDPNTYYIVHDVTYNTDLSVSEQHWYVYYPGWQNPSIWAQIDDPRITKHFEEARIYGSAKMGLVYFHRNVPGTTTETAVARATTRFAPTPLNSTQITYLVNNKLLLGQTGTSDDEKNAVLFDLVSDATGKKLYGLTPSGSTQSYLIDETFKNLSYTIDVTKKIPAPIQNLEGIIGIVKGQGAPRTLSIAVDQVTLCGGQTFTVSALPSDMTATATLGSSGSSKQIGKNTFDNEKKYWYDFSFALPLKSYQDLTVSSTDLTVTAKKVEKQSLFAVVNLSPFPYDTKKASFQVLPVFLYGMPITGKPLNHHLIAAAVGLNRVQFFAGVLVSHNKDAPGSSVSGSSSSSSTSTGPIRDYWSAKLAYGINFPVSTITSLLKK